ncbi:hypothetical protein ACHAWO_004800 [Cyclotella atomus]|uniref:Uncharacterized protein n=1 Tax=Cyclotella atomus TaxID=382360 RepID=A0ABD3NEG3_9STRA
MPTAQGDTATNITNTSTPPRPRPTVQHPPPPYTPASANTGHQSPTANSPAAPPAAATFMQFIQTMIERSTSSSDNKVQPDLPELSLTLQGDMFSKLPKKYLHPYVNNPKFKTDGFSMLKDFLACINPQIPLSTNYVLSMPYPTLPSPHQVLAKKCSPPAVALSPICSVSTMKS